MVEVFNIGFQQNLQRFVKYIWKTHLGSYVNEVFFLWKNVLIIGPV